jgi:membrane protease YdiL (CAAX protease family)
VSAYFFTALPAELLLRGGAQNGLARALRDRLGAAAPWLALAVSAALSALAGANGWLFWRGSWMAYPWIITIYGAAIGLAAGWTYQRTGKVTASAVTHALIIWFLLILLG